MPRHMEGKPGSCSRDVELTTYVQGRMRTPLHRKPKRPAQAPCLWTWLALPVTVAPKCSLCLECF